MDLYNESHINNNNVNVNLNSNVQLNIGKVLNSVKNRTEAKWFCLQNSNIIFYF